jgi:hypothetical protein
MKYSEYKEILNVELDGTPNIINARSSNIQSKQYPYFCPIYKQYVKASRGSNRRLVWPLARHSRQLSDTHFPSLDAR